MRTRYDNGLSMIELMLVLTIASILLAVSVPGFQDMISRITVSSQVTTLQSALNYARSEAVRQNTSVTFCPRDDSWSDGWEVVVGEDCDSGNDTLRVYDNLSGGTAVSYSSSDSDSLSYDSMGFNAESDNSLQFVICPEDGDTDRAQGVEVSITGRARLVEEGLSCS